MKKRLFVVIHALSTEEYGPLAIPYVLESARIVFEAGAHGVFLMPHYKEGNARASQFDLARYYHFLYEKYKKEDFKVGLNFYLGINKNRMSKS